MTAEASEVTTDPAALEMREENSPNIFAVVHTTVEGFVADIRRHNGATLMFTVPELNVFLGNRELSEVLHEQGLSLLIVAVGDYWRVIATPIDNIYERMVASLERGRTEAAVNEALYREMYLAIHALQYKVVRTVVVDGISYTDDEIYDEDGLLVRAHNLFDNLLTEEQRRSLKREGLGKKNLNQVEYSAA